MLNHILTNKYFVGAIIFYVTYKYLNNLKAAIFISIGSAIILEASLTLCSFKSVLETFDMLKTDEDRKTFCDMMNKVRIGCQNPETEKLKGLCKNYNTAIKSANDNMMKILNEVN